MVHIAGPRAGREARLAARFPGCGAVVYGHTHVPQVDRLGEAWILNPGSPTERRRAPAHTMLELRVDGSRLEPELVVLD
jgi:predicted phosphodiesterase